MCMPHYSSEDVHASPQQCTFWLAVRQCASQTACRVTAFKSSTCSMRQKRNWPTVQNQKMSKAKSNEVLKLCNCSLQPAECYGAVYWDYQWPKYFGISSRNVVLMFLFYAYYAYYSPKTLNETNSAESIQEWIPGAAMAWYVAFNIPKHLLWDISYIRHMNACMCACTWNPGVNIEHHRHCNRWLELLIFRSYTSL